MRRMLHLIGSLMLAVMLWTSTTAHAAEAFGCIEVTAESFGHFEGDGDQVPSDSDKATPHHHGGCHGHHVGVAADAECAETMITDHMGPRPATSNGPPSPHPDPTLRPPIA